MHAALQILNLITLLFLRRTAAPWPLRGNLGHWLTNSAFARDYVYKASEQHTIANAPVK